MCPNENRIGGTHVVLRTLALVWLAGCGSTEPGNLRPTVELTAPRALSSHDLGSQVEIRADASDGDGSVAGVWFYADGAFLGRDEDPPYAWTWDTRDETRRTVRLSALAVDDDGATARDSMFVRVEWVYRRPEDVGDGWETGLLQVHGMDPAPLVGLVNLLRDTDDHLVHGIVIVRDGRLLFESYFPGIQRTPRELVQFDRDVPHNLASTTKSITSALQGIAIDQGFISSVHAVVSDFFPEFPWMREGEKAGITLEHMVTMSSGLEWDQQSQPILSSANDIHVFQASPTPWEEYLGRPVVTPPGRVMNYSEGSINVVGEVVRRASGMSTEAFSQRYLFGPLGIVDFSWPIIATRWTWTGGDLRLTPRDMARFGQLYLQGGVWEGERLVSAEWVARAARPYHVFDATSSPHEQYQREHFGCDGYSYAWWTLDADVFGEGAYTSLGWGDQRIVVLPAWDMVVAFTGGSHFDPPLLTSHEILTGYVLEAVR
ncbi:MAG: serine hydrolase [Gemmatimonadota bacterium]|jgi:CubicO group peptidase (beta-lactamase class C family)